MSYQFVIGIDISKHSFDIAILLADSPENIFHNAFSNDENGFKDLMIFAPPWFVAHETVSFLTTHNRDYLRPDNKELLFFRFVCHEPGQGGR